MSRFAAHSPYQNYYTKVRWLVGGMVSLIILLSGSLLLTASTWNDAESITLDLDTTQFEETRSFVDIPVAHQRIEVGEAIQAQMISLETIPLDDLPRDAVQARDRSSIVGLYATKMIAPGMPISHSALSNRPPVQDLTIPPGFRAVTVSMNRRQAAAGFAIPGSRVDVMLSYKDRTGTSKLRAFAKFIKVLAVNGRIKANNRISLNAKNVEVTLLASEQEAKKIELAQTVGSLSLALIGKDTSGPSSENDGEIDVWTILGRTFKEDQEPIIEGKFVTTDLSSGRLVIAHLVDGRWERVSEGE